MFFRMTDSRRVPDLFVLKEENRSRLTPSALNGPADLAIEIISKDSGARDWRDKYLEYEAAGVAEYWVIDPVLQVFECYTLGSDRRFGRIEIKADTMSSVVLPGLFIRPSWLWQKPLPPVTPLLREMGVAL
jgi:Uma2 family endonuclease